MFEKPTGFRDFPPPLAERKRMVEERIRERFTKWGYREVGTPTLEYYDTVGSASAIAESRMFKCIDREGNTLVLRPDQTAPIARVVTSILKREPLPLRLCYHANVFRAQENKAGRSAEFFQSGVELVGDAGAEADAEVIALAIEALEACQIRSFQIALGHVGLLESFLRERIPDEAALMELKEKLGLRDLVSFRRQLAEMGLKPEVQAEIDKLVHAGLDREQLRELVRTSQSVAVHEAAAQLEEVWECLEAHECADRVIVDLSLVGNLGYYTGVYFEGYASGQGFPLVSGGRYDRLYEHFRRFLPATGFAVQIDHLLAACPLNPERKGLIGLYYHAEMRREALAEARRLREQGFSVVTQAMTEGEQPEPNQEFDRLIIWPNERGEGSPC
jgi:ATP phosphoribosyltransferase regulatory subunit